MAEEEGFEPPSRLLGKRFSRPPVSSTHALLRRKEYRDSSRDAVGLKARQAYPITSRQKTRGDEGGGKFRPGNTKGDSLDQRAAAPHCENTGFNQRAGSKCREVRQDTSTRSIVLKAVSIFEASAKHSSAARTGWRTRRGNSS